MYIYIYIYRLLRIAYCLLPIRQTREALPMALPSTASAATSAATAAGASGARRSPPTAASIPLASTCHQEQLSKGNGQ